MLKAKCTCSHKKKRMRQIKKMAQRGLLDPEQEDPFSLFVASTDIRYCYYHDTHKILGNTFGMCVLQVCITFCLCCHFLTMQSMLEQSMSSVAKHACAALSQQFTWIATVQGSIAAKPCFSARGKFLQAYTAEHFDLP